MVRNVGKGREVGNSKGEGSGKGDGKSRGKSSGKSSGKNNGKAWRTGLLSISLAIAVLLAVRVPAHTEDAEAHWAWGFDGHAEEESGSSGHDGTIYGAVFGTGIMEQGLLFDGVDDYVSVDGTGIDAGAEGLTISAWIKPQQDRAMERTIAAKGAEDTGHYQLYINMSGELCFYAYDAGQACSGFVVDDGNWRQVAATYDGSKIQFYINGVYQAEAAATGTIAAESEELRIGASLAGTKPYKGAIDEVRIFNQPLPASGIRELYAITPRAHEQQALAGSSASSSLSGWEVAKLINGNDFDAWGSDVTPSGPIWATVELARAAEVRKVQLVSRGDFVHFPADFKFQSSSDGATWTDIAGAAIEDYPLPTDIYNNFVFEQAVTASYIRVVASSSPGNMMHLAEMRVYGHYADQVNEVHALPVDGGVAVSSLNGWDVDHLWNQNWYDAWGSQPTAPDADIWVALELQGNYDVEAIQLLSRGDFVYFPRSFTFQSSTNGTDWVDIPGAKYCAYPAPTRLYHNFVFDSAVNTAHLRLLVAETHGDGKQFMTHLAEIKALGSAEAAKLIDNPEAAAAAAECADPAWDAVFDKGPQPEYNNSLAGDWVQDHVDILSNFDNLYNAEVVYDAGSSYPYKMWLFGQADDDYPFVGVDKIYFARSENLESGWEVYSGNNTWDATMTPSLWVPVLDAGTSWYDDKAAGDPSVVLQDGVFYMAYSSVGWESHLDPVTGKNYWIIVNSVMAATSADGINWTRSAAPILIWEDERTKGVRVDWDYTTPDDTPADYYGGYHRPSLLFEDGKWRLWFDYYYPDAYGAAMGYAENDGDFLDPVDWVIEHAGHNYLLANWANPDVIAYDGVHYSFADPYFREQFTRYTTMAMSTDGGITWEKLGYIPELGTRSNHVPQAFIHVDDNEDTWLYVFYASAPEQYMRYTSIRAMKMLLD